MLSRHVRLERDTIWLSFADIIALLVGIAVHVVLTQAFSNGDYGRWILLLDLYYVLSTIIDLGLPTLIGRDSERLGKHAHQLVSQSLNLQSKFAIPIILLAGFIGWFWVGNGIDWLVASFILIISACTQILTYAHRAALRSLGESRQEALVRFVDRGATAIGIVIVVWLLGASPIPLALATFMGPMVAIIIAINLGEKKLEDSTNNGLCLETKNVSDQQLMKLGFPFLMAAIALVVNIRVEKILLGVIATPNAVETFQIAWLAFIAGYALILSIRAVMLSWYGEVRHDYSRLMVRRKRARILLIPAAVIGILIGYSLGRFSIGWIFPDYANESSPVFMILLVSWLFALLASEPLTAIQIGKKPSVYAGILWLGILIDAVICIILIPSTGVFGAAIGSAFGTVSVLGLAIGWAES
jgi:O-antigen/teichoic acid export membrane protein